MAADEGAARRLITPVLVTHDSGAILPWSLPPLAGCAEVIVVDNASGDDTREVVARMLPQARILASADNLGFGRANNLGLAQVRTPYALLLNPDARLDEDALDALLDAARRHPEAAIVAPVLYDAPGRVGDFFRGPFHAPASHPAPEPAGDLCTEFVTGAAMLLRMDLMRGVGFFDPWFFLYFEDDDLCLRVRRAGHPILVARGARVEHHVRQSSRPSAGRVYRRAYTMTLSKLYITRKYLGAAAAWRTGLRIGLGSLPALLLTLPTLRADRILRQAGRFWAAVTAPWWLGRPQGWSPRPR